MKMLELVTSDGLTSGAPFLGKSPGIVNRFRKAVFLCHFYFQYLDINSFDIYTTLKKPGNEKE